MSDGSQGQSGDLASLSGGPDAFADVEAAIKPSERVGSSGLRIVFRDLNYHVASNTAKGERAYLLKSVSAFLEPAQMTALMGPSGSGKTTLLDLLAGRKTVGTTEGHLTFGGVRPTPAFLRRYTGYVEQFDTLLGDLTVREMLLYTAELKRPVSESLKEKKEKVETLLRRLALDTCADVPIGDPLTKGISGGQAKRTNIGIALITNPRVLFLDEPTSGLDSFTANEVMKVVAGLKDDGTTIAATIHSPTAATFALFDRVMMLVRGQLVYFGPQGMPALEFAAEHWPQARQARRLLRLHRTASAEAAAEADAAAAAAAAAGGGRRKGQGNTEDEEYGGSASELLSAFNDAEILVETVTEADVRKEAGMLAEKYNNSALKKENDALLDLHIANGGNGVAANGKAAADGGRLCKVASRLGLSGQQGQGQQGQGQELVPRPPSSDGGEPSPQASSLSGAAAGAAVAAGGVSAQVARELATRSETVTPWYWGLVTLLKYRTGHNYRSGAWLGARVADKLLISLIILTLYLGVGDNLKPDNLINVQSALFMWALLPAFGAASYVPAIVLERRLFYRERADGLYRVFTYLAAKLIEEIFLALLITLVFSAYVFHGLQLKGDWVIFWLVYFIDLSVGIALAYLVAALSPNMDVANAALPGFVVTLLFFAGQLMTVDAIPVYWQWYSKIDFLRYAWGALMLNQFERNDVEFAGGLSILQYYGLAGADKWAYIGYLAIFWIVFVFLALMALSYVRHQKR